MVLRDGRNFYCLLFTLGKQHCSTVSNIRTKQFLAVKKHGTYSRTRKIAIILLLGHKFLMRFREDSL